MKGYRTYGQGVEDNLNVMLRPTRSAYTEVWEVKANKFTQKLEDLFLW